MTLGDWLNHVILEDAAGPAQDPANETSGEPPADELGRLRETLERLAVRIESAEERSSHAVSGVDQTVAGLLARLERTEQDQAETAARLAQIGGGALPSGDGEGSGQRPAEALRALEAALGKVAAHLYASEARTQLALDELRAELAGVRQDAASAAGSEGLVDQAVSRIVERLEEAEVRTSAAIQGLETSLADFEQRLAATEARGETAAGPLEQLAEELSRRFEARSQELAERISQTADARLSAVEGAVGRMAGEARASEQRAARIADKMGHEVLRLAETLGRRMETVETRSAAAIEQVGGEVARIAEAMEDRLRRADEVQAESLERLGGEIARISERLSERLASSERRTAQAMDQVGERVSRVADRLNERHDRASAELADRIRQSEERTARLLQEAREKIDRSLSATPPRAESVMTTAPLPAPEPTLAAEKEEEDEADLAALFADPEAALGREPEPPSQEVEDDAATRMFARLVGEAEHEAPEGFGSEDLREALELPAPGPEAEEEPPLSTRELIERARAAARAEAGQAPEVLLGAPSPVKRKPGRSGARLRRGVMIAAGAAALGVSTAGLTIYGAQIVDQPRSKSKDADAIVPGKTTPQAAVALAPQVIGQPTPLAAAEDLQALYASAVRRIEAKDHSGVADLRRAANLGYGPAQFYLAKLYEGGEAGVAKDLAEARRWTQRAAQAGERKAMHNLALYYFEGTGGVKDMELAAQWFRKAAELGVVDSQYNLAKLYDAGYGVPKNPAEAYKWYLIAARSGDAESMAAAAKVKPELAPQAAAAIEAAARGFHPDEPASQLASAG